MAQQVKQLETLIVGATFAGIGLACQLQHQERTLIVEREITVGHEFIYAYKHGQGWQQAAEHEATASLRSELMNRNVLTADGRAHLPGVAPVLYRFIRERRLPIRLMTELISVQADSEHGGYQVTLFDGGGLRQLHAEAIIDTTSDCRSKPNNQSAGSRRINALLHTASGGGELMQDIDNASYSFIRGRFATEAFLSLPLAAGEGWTEGRSRLHDFWLNRPEELQDWTLASAADQLAGEPAQGPHLLHDNWEWLPSAAYSNPLKAMDEGIAWLKGRDNQ